MSHRPHDGGVSVIHPSDHAVVIELKGDHDLATRSEVMALMNDALESRELLVIDLSEATFIDSSFIHSIVEINKSAKELDKHVRIQLGTTSIVERALEASGVMAILDRVHTGSAPRVGPREDSNPRPTD